MAFFKKRLRRPAEHYRGRQHYFVTVGTERRATFFADRLRGEWLLRHLVETAAQRNFSLHAYCVMPDHVHFLCEGLSEASDLVQFVDAFKQRTAYEFKKTHGERLWQMRYYDHILRPKEVPEDVACYIWWNPVRKGLCGEPHLYPLSGSQTIDWMKHSSGTNWTPPWKANTNL
ncbi:MAG: transposase [Candidatus Acidiferrum sp.]